MRRVLVLICATALAACSTTVEPEPSVRRADAEPRAALTSLTIGSRSIRTLAGEGEAQEIARRSSMAAAAAFAGDNKGNACFEDPVLEGVIGGELNREQTRREEFWTYSVCGEPYEVPVTVTKQQGSGTVAFRIGSGREAR
ncbi:hypothetical protein [Parvularcula maris]|uniref:Lipoprotein n=1 Tax=Parvularcula maris TaxID=2965077 RepID=A0A9X2L8V3_9PROT|nr:hypothetical protein [Parvularcula maris]MCQ8184342.1 hypothetical protein [Parvularcula maris]